MSLSLKTKLFIAALSLVVSLPTAAQAQRRLAEPVQEGLEFEARTTTSSLITRSVRRLRLLSANRLRFGSVDVFATVEAGAGIDDRVIVFEDFELVNGDTTILVEFQGEADLVRDRRGSSFNAPVLITISTVEGDLEIAGRIRGRIALRRGNYILEATVNGAITTNEGGGNGLLTSVCIPITARAVAGVSVAVE